MTDLTRNYGMLYIKTIIML